MSTEDDSKWDRQDADVDESEETTDENEETTDENEETTDENEETTDENEETTDENEEKEEASAVNDEASGEKAVKPNVKRKISTTSGQAKRTGRKEIPKVGDGETVIAVRRASLWYGQVIGINDITLDIGSGVLGLLGPNGAGKSTFLKCLTGQLRPSTGTVAVDGKIVWNSPEVMSQIGFVPEQDAFYEDMSGHEFVTYLTRLQGYSASDAHNLAAEAIETVDLTSQKDRKIREYSKGMRQRIKIAQALAHQPRILFLDEPLTGTDPVGRRHIIELIRELGAAGRTIIVSSHILHEVEQMTTNIVLINKGRVIADGNIYRIREMIDEHPHTIFIDCDRPREMAALMTRFEDIVSIDFTPAGVHVATEDPDECYSRIPAVALENGISIRRIASPDNNLMAVFKYLVN